MSSTVAIPDPPAEPERLRESAELLRTTAARFELLVQQALFAWNLLPESYRAPEADLLHTSLATTRPAAGEIAEGLAAACRVLERFAEDIEELARHRNALIHQRDAGPPANLWDEGVESLAEALNERRRTEWERDLARTAADLEDAYDEASRRCAAGFREIPDVAWSTVTAWNGPEVSRPVGSVFDAAGLAVLGRLAGASDPAHQLAEHPEWATIIARTDPARVAEWWSRLQPDAAGLLVAAAPLLIGNLDGIAISDRVTAHKLRAADRLTALTRQIAHLRAKHAPMSRLGAEELARRRQKLGRLEREAAYLEQVVSGAKMLYAWDPDRGSLIEMSGDPSSAKAALFVVPGTNTTAESFMDEKPLTRFGDWQVRSSQNGVVAFTVMTGPMPQIDTNILQTGPQWNSMAADRGLEYARFVQGIGAVEPDLWTMSYEHSYGGAIGSEAEKHGGTVDARFLAASVGAIGPYEPNPGTTYFATQAPDDINRYYAGVGLGPAGFTVAPESIPGIHIVDSGIPGFDPFAVAATVVTGQPTYIPSIISRSIDHHSVLMSDDESENGPVLRTVRDLLAAGRVEK